MAAHFQRVKIAYFLLSLVGIIKKLSNREVDNSLPIDFRTFIFS